MEEKKKEIAQPFRLTGGNSIENIMLLIDECNKECDRRKRENIKINQNKNLLMIEGNVFYHDCETNNCEECSIEKRRKNLNDSKIQLRNWGVGL